MIQYRLLKFSPRLLRWYRTKLLLDMPKIMEYLPKSGRLLDVGCGVGTLDYEIVHKRPGLEIFAIDIDEHNIEMAQTYHHHDNIHYSCIPIQSVQDRFDALLFVDVFHHINPAQYSVFFEAARNLLRPNGCILVKDVERHRGQVSLFMDKYISGCEEVYLHNCGEFSNLIPNYFKVSKAEVRFRFPFPHYYIRAEKSI